MKSSDEVAYRTLALMAVCFRASAEQVLRQAPHEGWERALGELRAWAVAQGVEPHLSDAERDALARPVGELEFEEVFDLSWRLQAASAALWAIGKVDPMPTYARSVAARDIQDLVPLRRPVDEFLATARLRPEPELDREQTRASFWNWRARCDAMRRRGMPPPPGQSYEAAIASAAESALGQGLIDATVAGDVSCDGRPYRDLSDEEFSDAASTALERHRTLNWICDDDEDDWDEVSTDT